MSGRHDPPEYRLFLAGLAERAGVAPDRLTHWQTLRLGTVEEPALAAVWLRSRLTPARTAGAGWEAIEWAATRLADAEECRWWAEHDRALRRGRRRRPRPSCASCGVVAA